MHLWVDNHLALLVQQKIQSLTQLPPESEPTTGDAPMTENTTPRRTSSATTPATATAVGNTATPNLPPPAVSPPPARGRKPAPSSGWVKGSPVALSSSSSTPSRGRRQLPQTPLTPRPGVAYKTANSSPVHLVSSQASLSPGRLRRGQSEHNTFRQSGSHHFPCPVTRISSEPFLGQGHGEDLGRLYGSLRDQLDVFQDAVSRSPSPCAGQSSRTALPHMMGALLPAPQQNLRVPNGYHFSFGGRTSPGSGVRAPRYYQEAEEDEWC